MPWEGALPPGARFLSGLVCLCCCRMGHSQVEELGSQSLSRLRQEGGLGVALIILIHLRF